MSAEEQSHESKHEQQKNGHVSDSFYPSPGSQPVKCGQNIGEPQVSNTHARRPYSRHERVLSPAASKSEPEDGHNPIPPKKAADKPHARRFHVWEVTRALDHLCNELRSPG